MNSDRPIFFVARVYKKKRKKKCWAWSDKSFPHNVSRKMRQFTKGLMGQRPKNTSDSKICGKATQGGRRAVVFGDICEKKKSKLPKKGPIQKLCRTLGVTFSALAEAFSANRRVYAERSTWTLYCEVRLNKFLGQCRGSLRCHRQTKPADNRGPPVGPLLPPGLLFPLISC